MERFRDICCKILSIILNLVLVYNETIAARLSWEAVGMQMFTFYTENSNFFSTAVCALVAVCQVIGIFTGRPLPRWVKRLKYIATTCLTMTMLTVVFVLAPYYRDEGGWYWLLFTSSMLYHHFLNPLLALVSFALFERAPRLSGRNVPLALLPSVLYGSIALWANAARLLDGPYPFLQVYNYTTQQMVLMCTAVLASNLFYAWLVWKLGGNARRGRVGLEMR